MAHLSPNERGALVGADSRLNAKGVQRIENALVAKAYGEVDDGVLRKFAEATDDNTRSIVGAMADVAARWARLRDSFKRGDLDPALDPISAPTDALRRLSQWRAQAVAEKRPVSVVIREGMAQGDMLGGMEPEAEAAITMMYANDHFTKAVGRDVLFPSWAGC